MNRRLYSELKKKIESRYKKDLEALERVWTIANEDSESALTPKAVDEIIDQAESTSKEQSSVLQNGHDGPVKRFSLRREIERMITEFGPDEDITQGDIRHKLEHQFPDHSDFFQSASVSSALRRIAQSGDLVLISTGTGSEPNRYRKPEDVDAGSEEQGERLLSP